METRAVIGRDAERAAIERYLAAPTRGRAALLMTGEPGIGKTTVWEAGLQEAARRGYRVLTHRGVEAEAGLAFTALTDLMTSVVDEVLPVLTSVRRRALAVALMIEEAGRAPAPDLGAIGLALMDALRTAANSAKVLIAIDDVQWLDSSTARVLPLALRRMGDVPVATLATLRLAPDVRAPFDVARTFTSLEELRLYPLTLGQLHRLLRNRLGLELSRPDLTRVLETSGGNPFFALEIGREFARTGGSIRVPASLEEALGRRLGRLPQLTMDTLLVAAASNRPTVASTVTACESPQEAVLDALDHAVREGLITVEDDRVRFTHPMLASLSYQLAMPWKRRRVHTRLATVVEDLEENARHVALAAEGVDASVATTLDSAALHAAARGATAAAAELAELATERTPSDDAEGQYRRRLAAAGFHHLAGDFAHAAELLRRLCEEMPPGAQRADALYARALLGRNDIATRVGLLQEALRETVDDDRRTAQIQGFLGVMLWLLGDLRAGLRQAREGLARAETLGDARAIAVATGRVGLLETWALDMTPGVLERAAEFERGQSQPLMFIDSPRFVMAQRLYETDGLDEARSQLQELRKAAEERGDEHTRLFAVGQLLVVEWYSGRWKAALDCLELAREIGEQTQELQYGGMVGRFGGILEADLGLFERARQSAEDGLRLSRLVGDEVFTIGNLWALGHLELARGDIDAAVAYLRELPARQLSTGHRSSLVCPWPDAIETLVAAGALDEAQAHLQSFRPIAAASNRWARVGAARCEGLLAAAAGDRTMALDAFERAVAADDPPMYPFERARTLLACGAVRRQAQQRRAARETLGEALGMFNRLNARPWAEKTREELDRISGRRGASDGLTEAERRVAIQAAEGRHNKEIAAALFITVRTVEATLTRVYRKLGVRSRTELAQRLRTADRPEARAGDGAADA